MTDTAPALRILATARGLVRLTEDVNLLWIAAPAGKISGNLPATSCLLFRLSHIILPVRQHMEQWPDTPQFRVLIYYSLKKDLKQGSYKLGTGAGS
jgi:hypothetical protein